MVVRKILSLESRICDDVEFSAKGCTNELLKKHESDLQLYGDDEMLDYIKSRREELRYYLKHSEFSSSFPINKLDGDLTECLRKYLVPTGIIFAENIDFSTGVEIGKYEMKGRTLVVNTQRWNYTKYRFLFFTDLDLFMALAQYIANARLFIKLNNLEKEIKEKISENNIADNQDEHLDYADKSLIKRIVFLYELGVLDYLQNKMLKELNGFSACKLAEIVSTFSGIKYSTGQTYLNPIYSNDKNQKNYPLTKDSTEDIKNKLMKIGFISTKSSIQVK